MTIGPAFQSFRGYPRPPKMERSYSWVAVVKPNLIGAEVESRAELDESSERFNTNQALENRGARFPKPVFKRTGQYLNSTRTNDLQVLVKVNDPFVRDLALVSAQTYLESYRALTAVSLYRSVVLERFSHRRCDTKQ